MSAGSHSLQRLWENLCLFSKFLTTTDIPWLVALALQHRPASSHRLLPLPVLFSVDWPPNGLSLSYKNVLD